MAIPGRKALVRVSGAAVAFIGAATTRSTGTTIPNTVYQITDPAFRILEREAAMTVHVGGAVANPSNYTVNRLTGTVTFNADQGAAVVTVDGSYLPMSTAAEAYEYTWTLSADNGTSNYFGDTYVRRSQGMKDVTASLSRWHTQDSIFSDALMNGDVLLLEFYADASTAPDLRMWAIPSSDEISISMDSLSEESIDFEGAQDADGRTVA